MSGTLPASPVFLGGIEFNWTDSREISKSLPLQDRSAEWVPEYRSVVAYAIGETSEAAKNGKLKIKAHFRTKLKAKILQVRAKDVSIDICDVFSGKIIKRQPGKKALGNVAPTSIYFNEEGTSIYRGKHSYVPMVLDAPAFPDLGVGIYDVNLAWEFRLLNKSQSEKQGKAVWFKKWMPITLTKHRVYVTLDKPGLPWKACLETEEKIGEPYLWHPWSLALDIACSWAAGAADPNEAAKMISDRLWESGRFNYDTSPHYYKAERYRILLSDGSEGEKVCHLFNFAKMVERIQKGQGLGEKANCMDCALTVAVLSNLLGCRLSVARLQNSPDTDDRKADIYEKNRFEVNRIWGIGDKDPEETMLGIQKEEGCFFSYHAVAWTQPGKNLDEMDFSNPEVLIFDASQRFVLNEKEGKTLSGAGLRLGEVGETGSYRALLAANTAMGQPRCQPQPETVLKIQLL